MMADTAEETIASKRENQEKSWCNNWIIKAGIEKPEFYVCLPAAEVRRQGQLDLVTCPWG